MNHYKEIADDFEKRWYFDQHYFGNLTKVIYNNLGFADGDRFLDLGCGTGNYDEALLNLAKSNGLSLKLPLYGVDLSEDMLEKYKERGDEFSGVHSCIAEFIKSGHFKFHKILLKEVIHHVSDRESFFTGLSDTLEVGGHALILTRPKKLGFPFFQKALDDFADSQPAMDVFIEELNRSGVNYELSQESIPIEMTKKHLFEMIEGKFMSFFEPYSKECIAQGLVELETNLKNRDKVAFEDIFNIIKIVRS